MCLKLYIWPICFLFLSLLSNGLPLMLSAVRGGSSSLQTQSRHTHPSVLSSQQREAMSSSALLVLITLHCISLSAMNCALACLRRVCVLYSRLDLGHASRRTVSKTSSPQETLSGTSHEDVAEIHSRSASAFEFYCLSVLWPLSFPPVRTLRVFSSVAELI